MSRSVRGCRGREELKCGGQEISPPRKSRVWVNQIIRPFLPRGTLYPSLTRLRDEGIEGECFELCDLVQVREKKKDQDMDCPSSEEESLGGQMTQEISRWMDGYLITDPSFA